MPKFNFVLLYVSDPMASAAFYSKLLGCPPVEASPTFAMLPLSGDVMLGLWLRRDVMPRPVASPGGSEIAFAVADADAVRATHHAWVHHRLGIVQPPTEMDFGHTFVALDPDGNRIRVYAPGAATAAPLKASVLEEVQLRLVRNIPDRQRVADEQNLFVGGAIARPLRQAF